MISTIIVAFSWTALGCAMASGLAVVLAVLFHLFALASGLLYGFQHDATRDERRHATHLLVGAGIFALIAAAAGGITLLIASFQ